MFSYDKYSFFSLKCSSTHENMKRFHPTSVHSSHSGVCETHTVCGPYSSVCDTLYLVDTSFQEGALDNVFLHVQAQAKHHNQILSLWIACKVIPECEVNFMTKHLKDNKSTWLEF